MPEVRIKKKEPPPQIQCEACGETRVQIGSGPPKDWGKTGEGKLVCGKVACRSMFGLPKYVWQEDR